MKQEYLELYAQQKVRTQSIVRESIGRFERKVTSEIRQDKNNKNMWKHINKLRGNNDTKKSVRIYGGNGDVLVEEEAIQGVLRSWNTGREYMKMVPIR